MAQLLPLTLAKLLLIMPPAEFLSHKKIDASSKGSGHGSGDRGPAKDPVWPPVMGPGLSFWKTHLCIETSGSHGSNISYIPTVY